MNQSSSLNPCFNGRYSQSLWLLNDLSYKNCLNPCFNGRYSQSFQARELHQGRQGLNPCFNGRYSQSAKTYVPLYTSIWGYVQAFRNAFVNTN